MTTLLDLHMCSANRKALNQMGVLPSARKVQGQGFNIIICCAVKPFRATVVACIWTF